MRMYVIVNKDMGKKIRKRGMTNKYHHVQATHAAIQYCYEYTGQLIKWANETLIVLGATNRQFWWHIRNRKYNLSYFREPDVGNEVTAFACMLEEKDFGIFKRLELL